MFVPEPVLKAQLLRVMRVGFPLVMGFILTGLLLVFVIYCFGGTEVFSIL